MTAQFTVHGNCSNILLKIITSSQTISHNCCLISYYVSHHLPYHIVSSYWFITRSHVKLLSCQARVWCVTSSYPQPARGSIHYTVKRFTAKSLEGSKPWDLMLQLSYRSEILHASRQCCWQQACHISERLEKPNPQFSWLRDITLGVTLCTGLYLFYCIILKSILRRIFHCILTHIASESAYYVLLLPLQ